MGTQKEYRQSATAASAFRGGSFGVFLSDGQGVYQPGCARAKYWRPNIPLDPCPLGATGYLTLGEFGGAALATPYFSEVSIVPAYIIEPGRPDLAYLYAAPASSLPRPLFGFSDGGFAMYYNLTTTDIQEYKVAGYSYTKSYDATQLGLFNSDVVPGSYYFKFPKLGSPNLVVVVSAAVRTMPEGYAKLNNRASGVKFTTTSGFDANGFLQLSYRNPNTIKWSGITSQTASAVTDRLYFSLRYLSDPADPQSEVTYTNPAGESPASFFPMFVSGADPRVLLASPFVTSFSLPPIFKGGSTAIAELELVRNYAAGGVNYDYSTRKFQIPVVFSNRYSEYASLSFGKKTTNVAYLQDFDADGFNNLTEWALNTRAQDPTSKPIGPVPRAVPAVFSTDLIPVIITPAYYGFTVVKGGGMTPAVIYTLQRSTDLGVTWVDMATDANWTLTDTAASIKLESKIVNGTGAQILPPGTATHLFRTKITLAP